LDNIRAEASQGAKTNTNTKQNTADNQHGKIHSACQDSGSNNEESLGVFNQECHIHTTQANPAITDEYHC